MEETGSPQNKIQSFMTITRNYTEIQKGGITHFIEQYAEKPSFIWFWRCGYLYNGKPVQTKSGLKNRPTIK